MNERERESDNLLMAVNLLIHTQKTVRIYLCARIPPFFSLSIIAAVLAERWNSNVHIIV